MPHTLSTERGVRTYVREIRRGGKGRGEGETAVEREERGKGGWGTEKSHGGSSRLESYHRGKKVSRWESGRREECLNKMMEERSVVFELKGASCAQTSTVSLAGDRLVFS